MRTSSSASLLLSICIFASFAAPLRSDNRRIVSIKPRIASKVQTIRVKDIVANPQILSKDELELEVTDAPTRTDETIGIIDLAYMLQRHRELMDVSIRGPKDIVIQRVADNETLQKAKSDIVSSIKSIPPWCDWDIDVMLSLSDETIISKASPFARVEVLPSDNKNMIGPVSLNIAFLDEQGNQTSKTSINPTILKKAMVMVMNSNSRQGQMIASSDIKLTPMWLGPENKDYITDESSCVGRELARSLSAGELLRSSDVLSPVCAKRGDLVWVECKSGALSIKLAVTAMEGGRQGDFIKVMNQPTQKIFSVELTGDRRASYNFGG